MIFSFKIKRQKDQKSTPYWEYVEISCEKDTTISDALSLLQKKPKNQKGEAISPVIWESNCLPGVICHCGMIINGKAGLACKTKLKSLTEPAVLEPLNKFPVIRDLVIDRTRVENDLTRFHDFIDVDKMEEPLQFDRSIVRSFDGSEEAFSAIERSNDRTIERDAPCISCLLCLQACPNYSSKENFVGPMVLNRVFDLQKNWTLLLEEGGVDDCGNSGNCQAICPEGLPLLEKIGKLKRQTTTQVLKNFF